MVTLRYGALMALWLLPSLVAAECSNKKLYVTSEDCEAHCSEGFTDLCIAYNANKWTKDCWPDPEFISNASTCMKPEESTNCRYECFAWENPSRPQSFSLFYIPYGDYNSSFEKEQAGNEKWQAQVDALPYEMAFIPFKNDDHVDSVGPLTIPPGHTSVYISGGGTLTTYVKGKVAKVTIEPDFLASATNVTLFGLMNIDMSKEEIDVSKLIPPNTKEMAFRNLMLTEFPTNFMSVTSLEDVELSGNFIESIGQNASLPDVFTLTLRMNNLTNFELVSTSIQSLILEDNSLDSIPPVLSQYTNLQELDLSNNPLTDRTVSQELYDVLNGLTTFKIDNIDEVDVECGNSTRKRIGDQLIVCVGENVKATTSKSGDGGSVTIIGAVVGVCVGIIVALGIGWWCYRRRHTGKNLDETVANTVKTGPMDTAINLPSIWNDDELLAKQVQSEDIEDVRVLGAGAYGVVHLVLYRRIRYLASKRVLKEHATRSRIHDFVNELKLVGSLDHPHVVELVGVAWTMESDLQGLFEYMEKGDLRQYLDQEKSSTEWTDTKLRIAIDIVEALVYVHSFDPPIVHRDLKSRNVLLTEDIRGKLSDFGVSRFESENATMTKGVGTAKWLAPEILTGSSDYSTSADIYSLGVILSELDTHNLPYSDVRNVTGQPLAEVALMNRIATGTIKIDFSETCPTRIYDIAQQCLSRDPSERPMATLLAYWLRSILKEGTVHPKPVM